MLQSSSSSVLSMKESKSTPCSEAEASLQSGAVSESQTRSFFGRCVDSFKPLDVELPPEAENMSDTQRAVFKLRLQEQALGSKQLSKRHAQLACLAGAIGTGLFIGSGNSFKQGGPAAVIIGFAIVALPVLGFTAALGELGVRYQAPSFTNYVGRFLHPSVGFATAWMYAICWLIVMPLELIAAAMVIKYWAHDGNAAETVNPAAWVSIAYVLIVGITMFGSRGYGEAEVIFSTIKVIAVLGFCIFAIVIACGGGPNHTYLGANYYHNPGAFLNGFKGVSVAIVNSAFAYGGTELAGLAAAQTQIPNRAFPSIFKMVIWRIAVFFIVAMFLATCLVPYTQSELGSSNSGTGSPFVLAIKLAGVKGLPSVFNCVILLSVFSVANAAFFGSTRVITALAYDGQAPKMFTYMDRRGRPLGAYALSLTFGLLCFLVASDVYSTVFDWMYALCSLSFLFLWMFISICHIRHRRACKQQGVDSSQFLYRSPLGVFGSYVSAILCLVIIVIQGWLAIWPLHAEPSATAFFQQYLSVPVWLGLCVGHALWSRKGLIRTRDMDVRADLREYDMDIIAADEEQHAIKMRKSILYRLYSYAC